MPQPERKAQSAPNQDFAIDQITFGNHQRMQLFNTVQTTGWQVVLDILESCCIFAETEHLQLDPLKVDDKAIVRHHAQTRGQRLLFERLQTKIKVEIAAILAGHDRDAGEDEELDEEEEERRILDPTK